MPTRKAHARWEGDFNQGKGQMEFGSGAFKGAYSAASRFEDGPGTNPEELLGAAHAGCFSMALTLALGQAGLKPQSVDTTAQVSIVPHQGGFKITKSHLICEASVPGTDAAAFQKIAESAKKGCPVSQALAGVEITLEAKLVGR
ncbi:MAG: OsmC family protein [Myxococcota bacterium]|nr:OsmC family protein [Myxococcota bacterium]